MHKKVHGTKSALDSVTPTEKPELFEMKYKIGFSVGQ